MANQRIGMTNVKHILRLFMKGEKKRAIARTLGIGRNTVKRYLMEFKASGRSHEELYSMKPSELSLLLKKEKKASSKRYEELGSMFVELEQEFKKTGATYQALWERYRMKFPDGYGSSQFHTHMKKWMQRSEVGMYWEHKFGDKLFVDFCGKKLSVIDKVSGEVASVEVLVAVLGGSQYAYVEAVESQKLPHFLEALQNALHFFGGVPRAIVPDNLKSAVSRADNYEPDINRNLEALALHYGTTVLPTRPRKPKDKPLAENGVNLIYQRIYYPLNEIDFYSLKDLNAAVHQELGNHNNRLFQNRPYSRRELFLSREKDLLEALPPERYEQREYWKSRTNKDALAYFRGHYYSVPHQYCDQPFYIQATHRTVEVFHAQNHGRLALHQRSYQKGGRTINPGHLPSNIRFVKNWSVEFFLKQGQKISEETALYFQKIFDYKAHPEQGYKACTGILSLQKGFSGERISAACCRADYFGNYGYKVIRNILEKGLDQVSYEPHARTDDQPLLDESHPNIRGSDYYQ